MLPQSSRRYRAVPYQTGSASRRLDPSIPSLPATPDRPAKAEPAYSNRIFRKGTRYSVEHILDRIIADRDRALASFHNKQVIDGDEINLSTETLRLFKVKGTSCVACGLEGKYFVKERGAFSTNRAKEMNQRWGLTLYGLDKDDIEVKLTKDHISAVAYGGPDTFENYQVMCVDCNLEKRHYKYIVKNADKEIDLSIQRQCWVCMEIGVTPEHIDAALNSSGFESRGGNLYSRNSCWRYLLKCAKLHLESVEDALLDILKYNRAWGKR